MIVIAIDGATFKVIKPNLHRLPAFSRLLEKYEHGSLYIRYRPFSPLIWCSMFSGLPPHIHGHTTFVKPGGRLKRREDIHVKFVWDVLNEAGYNVYAIHVPFVIPPYSFRVYVKFDWRKKIPYRVEEAIAEIEENTNTALKILNNEKYDLLIVGYTALDRLGHIMFGSEDYLKVYEKIDEAVGRLVDFDSKVLVVSDHGFDKYENVKEHITPHGAGDHDRFAIVIKKNINFNICAVEDVYCCIIKEVGECKYCSICTEQKTVE